MRRLVTFPPTVLENGRKVRWALPGLFCLLTVLSAAGGNARAAENVSWLYEVSVPVASQAAEERRLAASEALLGALTRLTGLAYVPRTPEVAAALEAPERYYNEFRFTAGAAGELSLVVQFETNPVLELIRSAGLPIWRATRERVLVWLVVQEGGERQLVGATTPGPLAGAFEERARARGLPLTLPLLDLEDQLAVDPAAVWGRLSQVVDPASARYGADVLLLGRMSQPTPGLWESDWQFWVDGDAVPFALEEADPLQHVTQAVDVLADELAARRIVHGREAGVLEVVVAGVRTPDDYGALLRYLQSLEFVDHVGVSGIRADRLWLRVETPADPERLLAAFLRDRRLFVDQLARIGSADLKVVWRGGD